MINNDAKDQPRHTTKRKIGEDVDYFLRIWRNTEAAYIPKVSAEIRRHECNTTKTADFSSKLIMIDILEEFKSNDLTPEQLIAVNRKEGREWAGLGHSRWTNGFYLESASAYIHAAKFNGSRTTAIKHLIATPFALLLKFTKFADYHPILL